MSLDEARPPMTDLVKAHTVTSLPRRGLNFEDFLFIIRLLGKCSTLIFVSLRLSLSLFGYCVPGLAWAICEHLVEVTRAPCLFATHFHELTALAEHQRPQGGGPVRALPVGISNFHVTAHIDSKSQKLSMLYKVNVSEFQGSFTLSYHVLCPSRSIVTDPFSISDRGNSDLISSRICCRSPKALVIRASAFMSQSSRSSQRLFWLMLGRKLRSWKTSPRPV